MGDWRSASTRTATVSSRKVWATQRIADPPKRQPAGAIHAYRPGGDATACGQALTGMQLWPNLLFRQRFRERRCHDCLRQI
jgi:hypothetical protein